MTDAAKAVDVEDVLDQLSLRGLPLWVAIAMAAVLIAHGFDSGVGAVLALRGHISPDSRFPAAHETQVAS